MPSHVMSFSHNFPFSLFIVAWVIPKVRHARCVRCLFYMEGLQTIISVQHIFIPYDINYSIYTRDSPWSVSLTWLYIFCFNPVISLRATRFVVYFCILRLFSIYLQWRAHYLRVRVWGERVYVVLPSRGEMWKLAGNNCFNDLYHNTRATFMLKYFVDYRC